jgi:hypothetical protein
MLYVLRDGRASGDVRQTRSSVGWNTRPVSGADRTPGTKAQELARVVSRGVVCAWVRLPQSRDAASMPGVMRRTGAVTGGTGPLGRGKRATVRSQ